MHYVKQKLHPRHLIALTLLIIFVASLLLRLDGAKAENGQALSISPPTLQLSADPGSTVTASIKLTNISSGDLLIKNQINDFGAKDETGEPNIIFDNAESTGYSLKNWVSAPAPFKIASKETKTVDFVINVPKDAEPGGHYAVFRFTGQAPELEETGVALSASIGSLVLLRISGDIKEQAYVAEYFSANSQGNKASFFEYPPVNFVERIHNDGNVHINPSGTIEILDLFNRKIDTLQVNGAVGDSKNPPRAVLPQSTRRFEQQLNKKWLFGPYKAKLNLKYGEKNQTLTSQLTFWVIPYKAILIILLLIILLILLIRFINRRYKQRIISKYAQSNHHQLQQHTPQHTTNQHPNIGHSDITRKPKNHK